MARLDVRRADLAQPHPRLAQQPVDALDRIHLRYQRREHRGLVAGAGADLEHASRRAVLDQRLGHARDDVRLGDGLARPDRKRGVLVGARLEALVDEQVPGHPAHHVEHARITDALGAQSLDQAVADALPGHPEAARIAVDVAEQPHRAASSSCSRLPTQLATFSSAW